MFYDLSYLFPWLLLAAVLGGFIGYRAESPEPQAPLLEGAFRNLLIALAVFFLIGLFGLFSGRFEYWLESLVWFVIFYLIGAFAGGALQRYRTA